MGRWLIIPISRDNRLYHFCSCNAAENEAHFVLECPQYNLIRYKFPSLLKNAVLKNLESFFQSDHHVDISLYLMKATALCHSMKTTPLKPT